MAGPITIVVFSHVIRSPITKRTPRIVVIMIAEITFPFGATFKVINTYSHPKAAEDTTGSMYKKYHQSSL